MRSSVKFALAFFAVFAAVILVRHGERALGPERPKDMPAQATFVQSSFDISRDEPEGDWIACGQDLDQATNFCRVTDQKGTVVYEGDFLPLADGAPLPSSALKVAPSTPSQLLVEGPAEGGMVPVIPLVDGNVLVPANDREALASRWAAHPEELARITQADR